MSAVAQESKGGAPAAPGVAAGFAWVLLANALWSFVPLLAKVGLHYMDPFVLTFVRILLSVAGFGVILLLKRSLARVQARHIPWLILGGLGMGGNYTLYIMGIEHTTASAANLVVQIEVVSLIIFSWLFLRERMTATKVGGILLTVLGVSVVLWSKQSPAAGSSSSALTGNLLVLLSGPAWGLYGLAQKVLSLRGVPATNALVWIFVVAGIVSGVPAMVMGGPVKAMGIWPIFAVAALALVCTVLAYVLIAKGFDALDASTVASTTSILPIFTIVNAHLLLKEQITGAILLGAALVVTGIVTVARADSMGAMER